jgi:sorting nexin-1/2
MSEDLDSTSPWDDEERPSSTIQSDTTTKTPKLKSKRSAIRSRNGRKTKATPTITETADDAQNSDPLGPLGGASGTADAIEPNKSIIAPIDEESAKISQEIESFTLNNERLSLFGKSSSSEENSSKSVDAAQQGLENISINDTEQRAGGTSQENSVDSKLSEQVPQSTFAITVGDPIKVSDLASAHTVYTVQTQTTSPNFSKAEAAVTRRYRDFRWLFHALENNNPGVIIPPPPEKQAVGRFKDDFIEGRRLALEVMLNKIARHQVLQNDPDFKIFLESDSFSSDVKSSAAANASTNHEEEAKSSGFMGSFGFSFSNKFVETDQFFTDKKKYIDSLESQFKYLAKSLDLVIGQRQELGDVTQEFANILATLSKVELSKGFSEVIENFSLVQERIRDIYYRQSLQDTMSISTTIDEYLRLINSIRNVFSQRQKSYFSLQAAEQELSKRRHQLEKLTRNKTTTLLDKINSIKQDVDTQEKVVVNARVAFDDISARIVKELERFEREKSEDFRDSVELFLENAIEAQKEAIELWETFYQRSGFGSAAPASAAPVNVSV